MKIIAVAIMLFHLFLIYRLLFSKKTGSPTQKDETIPSGLPQGYEPVIKRHYVLPDRSTPAQREDKKEKTDKSDEKANIFAAGSQVSDRSIIQNDELPEIFGKDSNPENLDIEKDESEPDGTDEIDAEEEAEDLRQTMGGVIEGYSEGITYDELTTVIHEVDTQSEKMSKEAMETLRNISETDVFEQMILSKDGRAARIAFILERQIENTVQDEVVAGGKNTDLQKFDISQIYD